MFDIPEELQKLVVEVDKQIDPKLKEIDDQIVYNQAKVLDAFRKEEVAEADLTGVNGYGDDDMGRDKLHVFLIRKLRLYALNLYLAPIPCLLP